MNLILLLRAQWDRVIGLGAFSVGGLAIILGWARVSEEALTAAQVPYIVSGGLGGIALIGLGAVAWISADLRDEWRKLDDLEQVIARAVPQSDGVTEHVDTGQVDVVPSKGGTSPVKGTHQKRTSPLRVRAAAVPGGADGG